MLIDVEIDGVQYQEMHVDGGAIAQLFLYPASLDPAILPARRSQTAYIIRNARLDPDHAEIERRTISIAGRAIATMLQASGYNDVVRTYFLTKRDGLDYNLAYIGADFKAPRAGLFEQAYMRALFDMATPRLRLASRGTRRRLDFRPPGLSGRPFAPTDGLPLRTPPYPTVADPGTSSGTETG